MSGSRHSEEPLCERSGVVFNSNAVQCVSSWPAFKTNNKNFCTMPSLERRVDIVGDWRETRASAGSRRIEKRPSCLPVLATPGGAHAFLKFHYQDG